MLLMLFSRVSYLWEQLKIRKELELILLSFIVIPFLDTWIFVQTKIEPAIIFFCARKTSFDFVFVLFCVLAEVGTELSALCVLR